VPADPKAMNSARVNGVPLIQHAPKSRVYQSLVGLSQALSGKPVTPIKAEPEGGFFSNFFGKRK
jgi:pilus assembly protein CpaE